MLVVVIGRRLVPRHKGRMERRGHLEIGEVVYVDIIHLMIYGDGIVVAQIASMETIGRRIMGLSAETR